MLECLGISKLWFFTVSICEIFDLLVLPSIRFISSKQLSGMILDCSHVTCLADGEMGHDLEMATRRSACVTTGKDQQPEDAQKQDEDAVCILQDAGPSPDGANAESPSSSGRNDAAEESSPKIIDLINVIACQPQTQDAEPQESENDDEELDPRGRSSPKNNSASDSGTSLELSLKRPRSAVGNGGELEERQPLRHSGGSAFSRCSSDTCYDFSVENFDLNAVNFLLYGKCCRVLCFCIIVRLYVLRRLNSFFWLHSVYHPCSYVF